MQYEFHPQKHPIHNIVVEVGAACNLNCKMCRFQDYIGYTIAPVSPDHIKQVLYQYKHYNPHGSVEFISGEIFAQRKLIYPYLEYCRDIGLNLSITTNGTLVTDTDLEFIKDNLEILVVSLDSHREDIHDFIRGAGTYNKATRLLKRLNHYRIPYSVTSIVSKLNVDHLTHIYDFLVQDDYLLHHSFNLLTKSYYCGTGKDYFYDVYSFKTEEEKACVKKKLSEYVAYTAGYKTSYTDEVHQSTVNVMETEEQEELTVPMCNTFERNLIVRGNGDVALCFDDRYPPIGNITDRDFDLQKIWEGEATQRRRLHMSRCLKTCGILSCNNKNLSFNKH